MAGQENLGDLWDQCLVLGLLSLFVCAGFRTLSLTSVQNLGSRDPWVTKLDLDLALCSCMLTHVSERIFTQDMIILRLGWVTRAV